MDAPVQDTVVEAIKTEEPTMSDTLSSYLPRVDQFYIPEWLTMQFIANNLISFTPLFSYGSTVISIERCKTALGFSIDICATMMIASILRISYYLITPYEITLLRQSIVMVLIQLVLLRTSLKYRPEEYKYHNLKDVESMSTLLHEIWLEFFDSGNMLQYNNKPQQLINNLKTLSFKKLSLFGYKVVLACVYKFLKFFDPGYKRVFAFWQWADKSTYWKFLAIFATLQILLTVLISKVLDWEEFAQLLGSIIGSLGLLVESLLPLPQIAILYTLKSIQGFKLILLVSWLCGDTLKITYLVFGAKNISILFFLFAFFQMSLDFYIAGQYIYYKYYYPKLRNEAGFQDEEIELTDFVKDQILEPVNEMDEDDYSGDNLDIQPGHSHARQPQTF
ncbi:Any1p KABA2_06S02222 [Maudiozyma barnettii]|uniref:PQ-loop repeat-containing protein 1 n=1 Tax=Maudiozyma barnettii TaxID=61262 RepID=A0A8H2VGM4_9SACH|nr:Any1p [Kazachstania barnettii]CAB4255296.1 similar to Saccharomyces cerevisiae YMR010W Putative protein of unknown function [Kazachstania barnettii]